MTAITINIDDKLLKFVKQFAKENNMTQREVIEQSIEKTRKEKLKEEIKDFFENMTPEFEEELKWLANAGLEDYNNNLIKIDNEK